jgi:predicted Ser/Thr protein kinase
VAIDTNPVIGGRYELLEPIASGAMGAVYRAHDGDREVAVKQLTDAGQSARFEIEARVLERLRHPRVVRVLDSVSEGDEAYLVMELVRGPDLGQVLADRGAPGLPANEALELARQAAEALQYVHEQQVVHRDVKPRNLIAGDDGVVLVDFGVARALGDEQGTRGIGTPRYMAPEVIVGEGVSARSDVYGLAATVWALLSGGPPAYGAAASLSETVPDVSTEVEVALRRGLDLRPERRFASVAALADALGAPVGEAAGESLAISLADAAGADQRRLEAVVRAVAGVFDAAAVSVALVDDTTGELVYQGAWGAAADEIVGVRLAPGEGIAGSAVRDAAPVVVPDCRGDQRFAAAIAAGTGYVPNTMLVVPLLRDDEAVGALSILDRRDGGAYGAADVSRAQLFAELTLAVTG